MMDYLPSNSKHFDEFQKCIPKTYKNATLDGNSLYLYLTQKVFFGNYTLKCKFFTDVSVVIYGFQISLQEIRVTSVIRFVHLRQLIINSGFGCFLDRKKYGKLNMVL